MKSTIEARLALGRILTQRRKAANLTQERLAEISGVPLRTVQRAERGDGISAESLGAVALVLGAPAEELLKEAACASGASPETRLSMAQISDGGKLLRGLDRPGSLQVGPEGEHGFNEEIGGLVIELSTAVEDGSQSSRAEALENADYLVAYCRHMGFDLFLGHHVEESVEKGKVVRMPSTVVIAAPESDPRIRRTAKGPILDYVMDPRTHGVLALMNRKPTVYDWMENQLLKRSYGEAQVRAAIQKIHDDVRKEKPGKRPKRK